MSSVRQRKKDDEVVVEDAPESDEERTDDSVGSGSELDASSTSKAEKPGAKLVPPPKKGWRPGCAFWFIVLMLILVFTLKFYEDNYVPTVEEYSEHFDTLGVPQTATASEIKKAFRELSLKWHPDKCKEEAAVCKENFVKIDKAYNALTDPDLFSWYQKARETYIRRDNVKDFIPPAADPSKAKGARAAKAAKAA
eukprot:tig00000692_g3221.t1